MIRQQVILISGLHSVRRFFVEHLQIVCLLAAREVKQFPAPYAQEVLSALRLGHLSQYGLLGAPIYDVFLVVGRIR